MVAACTFLYKLLCTNLAIPLRQVLPPSQAPRLAHIHPTRHSLSRLDMQPYQFETSLLIHCRESCRMSFPSHAVPVWNALPSAVLDHPLTVKGCTLSKWLSSASTFPFGMPCRCGPQPSADRKRMQTLKVALFGNSVLSVGTGPRVSCNLA